MKALLVALLCAGVLLVLLNQVLKAPPAPAVEYRYLPRDLDAYLREQPYPSALLSGLWTGEDVIRTRG